jgi:hypothetical protein
MSCFQGPTNRDARGPGAGLRAQKGKRIEVVLQILKREMNWMLCFLVCHLVWICCPELNPVIAMPRKRHNNVVIVPSASLTTVTFGPSIGSQ